MRRASASAAALVLVAAGLPGCIAVVAEQKPDPVHAEKLETLERRMDRVESQLPKTQLPR